MIKSILKYAGKYKILTIVATIMVAIAVAAQILPYIFAYQIISPLIAGEEHSVAVCRRQEWWVLPSALY